MNTVLISKALPLDDSDPYWSELNKLAQVVVRPKSSRRPLSLDPKLGQSRAVISVVSDVVDTRFFERASKLHAVVNYAVGINNINVTEAQKRGILICNTPDVLTNATAELTIGLIFAAARRFKEGNELIRTQRFKGWDPLMLLGKEVSGSRLGLIGFGRIGESVAAKAAALGMDVVFYSRTKKHSPFKQLPLQEVLSTSDFVSIHCDLNSHTEKLFGPREFARLKKGAFLINTARGEIIDESALLEALRRGNLSGAALDVFCNEPKLRPSLRAHPKIFVLPHLGSATLEARRAMAQLAVKAVVEILSGRMPKNRVN